MRYVGNCVDSFDEDGECLRPELGWADTSAFACAEEQSQEVAVSVCDVLPPEVAARTSGHTLRMTESPDGVFLLYDGDSDIHYFFVAETPETAFSI